MSLASKFDKKNLTERVISAVVLIPLVLGAVWWGGVAWVALVFAAVAAGLYEWLRLTAPKMPLRGKVFAHLSLLAIFAVALAKGIPQALALSVAATALLVFYAVKGEGKAKNALKNGAYAGLGIPYLAWSGLAMLALRADPQAGLGNIVYVLFVVWGTDIGAYFAGRIIGGPKIWPQISPKKTWAGLLGGMALAGLLGYLVADGFGEPHLIGAGIVAAFLAVVAQAGDFFESAVKRRAGAKDSGNLIPGHGGILDRVDGLLFAALAFALLSYFRG